MRLWLNQLNSVIPDNLNEPADLALYELESAFPGISFDLCEQASMGDGYRIEPLNGETCRLTGGKTGLLYGASGS